MPAGADPHPGGPGRVVAGVPGRAREAAELASDAWQILREHGAARSDSGALLFTLLGFKVPLGVVTVAAVKLDISSLRPDDARLLVLALHLVWLDGREYAGTLRHPLAPDGRGLASARTCRLRGTSASTGTCRRR